MNVKEFYQTIEDTDIQPKGKNSFQNLLNTLPEVGFEGDSDDFIFGIVRNKGSMSFELRDFPERNHKELIIRIMKFGYQICHMWIKNEGVGITSTNKDIAIREYCSNKVNSFSIQL